MSIKTSFTKKENTDSGLALLLFTLILGNWLQLQFLIPLAIAEVLVLLVAPVLVFPFTFLWLNASDQLGKIMSKLILTAVFFIFVWPVAGFRKLIGKDSLRLKQFKKDTKSVFTERNHSYTKSDFTTPY